jgi:hypothetical protein
MDVVESGKYPYFIITESRRRSYGDLSVFVACGVASVLRRDIDPRSVDLKYIQVIFEAMLEGLMGASAPDTSVVQGAPAPMRSRRAHLRQVHRMWMAHLRPGRRLTVAHLRRP